MNDATVLFVGIVVGAVLVFAYRLISRSGRNETVSG